MTDNVLDWLYKVRDLDEMINAKLAERQQLMDLATKCTPDLTGMPHGSGTSDKVGNISVKLAMLAHETDTLIDQLVDHKQLVISALEKLPPKEYLVLHKHFIQGMTWATIAKDMNYSDVHVWRLRVKALENLERVVSCN
jgi:DNA-directed RNA polymerase specialized sigma subunit